MRILAIDTASQLCGVALLDDQSGRTSVRQKPVTTHTETLLSLVAECLSEQQWALRDLSGIALCAGPGSFTGLRIGCATAKGLCYALGLPLVMVSSLAALSKPHVGQRSVLVVLDAFREKVYARCFPAAQPSESLRQALDAVPALFTESAWSPDALAKAVSGFAAELIVVGDCGGRYPSLFNMPGAHVRHEQAACPLVLAGLGRSLLLQGDVAQLSAALPTYITASAAEESLAASNSGPTDAGVGVLWMQ